MRAPIDLAIRCCRGRIVARLMWPRQRSENAYASIRSLEVHGSGTADVGGSLRRAGWCPCSSEDYDMKIATRLGPLVLALTVAATAGAQVTASPNPNPPLFDFKPIDINNDGRVSLEEAKPNSDLVSAFEMLDLNHDDFLTPLEFSRWNRAGKAVLPKDPTTAPSGSNGAQHMPDTK
jgi:hypothetical protein